MTLTDFGLLMSQKLDRMMFKKKATSPEPLLTSILHEFETKRRWKPFVRLTAELKDGTAFRLTIERVKP